MPVGAMDELASHRLSARIYPSCHEPSVDGNVKGCPLWDECTMSYKGRPSNEGGGPRNHCWELMKGEAEGGAVVRNSQPCFYGVSRQELVRMKGGVLQVIANEGESYETETYIASPTATDPTNRELKPVRFTVPPFQRVGESKKMVKERM